MKSMTIKAKIYAVSVLVIAGILTLAGLTFQSFTTSNALNKSAVLIQASETHMLMLRRHEKDFMARSDIKYHAKFQESYQTLIAQIDNIKHNLSATGIDENESIDRLQQSIHLYAKTFKRLVEIQEKIGLTPESGLRGALRSAVHEAETHFQELALPQLMADMLMLRRNEKDFMLRELPKYVDKFNHNIETLNTHLSTTDIDAQLKNSLAQSMKNYQEKFLLLVKSYQSKGLTHKMGLHGEMRNTIHKTEEIFQQLGNDLHQSIEQQQSDMIQLIIIVSLVILIVIIGALLTTAFSINHRLKSITYHLNNITQGACDLSVRLDDSGHDEVTEISQLFNLFVNNLKTTFDKLPRISETLEQAAENTASISSATHTLSMQQQSESNQVVSSIEQMLCNTQSITQNINQAAATAEQAKTTALNGKQLVHSVSSSINSLAIELQNSEHLTKTLESNTNNIGMFLDVIRGIAEQTNLLALNAAIEAARAGENGRGFAVVADEVRSLAQRTQESTAEIQSLIEKLNVGVKNTVQVMQAGTTQAAYSVEEVSKAIQSLEEITQAVEAIFNLNTGIAHASAEQVVISENIQHNITSIAATIQRTAEQASEGFNSSNNLKSTASELQGLVANYRF